MTVIAKQREDWWMYPLWRDPSNLSEVQEQVRREDLQVSNEEEGSVPIREEKDTVHHSEPLHS